MGQKINPIIFRLGVNKTWNTELYEAKKTELPLYTYQSVEITQYINKFFKNQGLILHSYKLHYNQSTLNVYISYFVPIAFKSISTKETKVIKKKNSLNRSIHILKFTEGLNLFTKKKYKIIVILKCTNKSFNSLSSKNLTFVEGKLKMLGKFNNKESFNFEDTFNVMCNSVLNRNSAFMISNYIAETLKKLKKHNRYLKYIKKIFEALIISDFSKIKGIKIRVSGKINRSRRTRTKVIIVGDVPVQTISSNLDYAQTTVTHNPNGSFGIKVWIIEKNENATEINKI